MLLDMIKGDNYDPRFVVTKNGNPHNLTGAELRFTIKLKEFDLPSEALVEKANLNAGGDATQIEMVDEANGKFTIHILPLDTEDLDGNIKYWWDIEMVQTSKKTTLVKDRILITQDITN